MQYPQSSNDALAYLSELPYFDKPGQLGQWGELVGFAAKGAMESYANSQDDSQGAADTDQSSGMPGSRGSGNASVPRQPSSMSTVSTAVVTQVSPQISPVMTQQQSSPGATVGANPMQFMPGGLSAEQAITPYGSPAGGGFPGSQPGISPYQPYTRDPNTGYAVPVDQYGQPINAGYVDTRGGGAYSPVSVGGSRMTDIPWIPIAIVGGVAALAFLWPKRNRKRAA